MLHTTADVYSALKGNELGKKTFEYYLQRTCNRINSIKGNVRSKRSIDWIGSAWKWVAGSPDAADWNRLLGSQERLIENNNHQYIINKKLFETTGEVVKKMNNFITSFKNEISKSDSDEVAKESLTQLLIIKEDIEEVVRACQLAKTGVINTNLLDIEEINRIVSEVESLPYSNGIEAIEYGRPSIFSNGTSLLYILSIPKVNPERFERLTIRASIIQNRQVELRYRRVMINHESIYGINDGCTTVGNTTICTPSELTKLSEEECLSKVLRGTNANCTFLSNKETLVELIEDDLLFVTNFNGTLFSQQSNKSLDGTYLIRFFNETIKIGSEKFVNERITNVQALPPLLANVYEKERKLDVNLLRELNEKNINHIEHLRYHVNISFWSHITGYLFMAVMVGILVVLWRKIFRQIKIPAIETPVVICRESN